MLSSYRALRLAQVNVTAPLLLVVGLALPGMGIAFAWRRTLAPVNEHSSA